MRGQVDQHPSWLKFGLAEYQTSCGRYCDHCGDGCFTSHRTPLKGSFGRSPDVRLWMIIPNNRQMVFILDSFNLNLMHHLAPKVTKSLVRDRQDSDIDHLG